MKNYNYGSAAPQIERIPHLRKNQQHNKGNKNYLNNNKKLFTPISYMLLFIIIGGIFILGARAGNYIKVINISKNNQSTIEQLEKKYSELKTDNDDYSNQLAIIDYNSIYKIATEELGMIYPSEKNIITYSSGESSYVIQFSKIPKNQKSLIINK